MKRTYINLMGMAFSALLCVALALPANAQRDGGNRGGGGGNNGGGGGARPAAPAGGGGGARPSFNGGGGQRMGGNFGTAPRSNNSIGPQRTFSSGPRQGINPGQRGVSATAQIGLAGRPAYRSYPGMPGAGGAYRIGRSYRPGGFYNAHGYYNSFYSPHLGFRLNVLPYGYYPFYFGADQFFYSDGLYYRFNDNQYEVVEPPVGAAINTLPDNAQSIVINGVQYYELNGVYYQPITKDDGSVVYQVAGKDGELNTDGGDGSGGAAQTVAPPQLGDMTQTLPQDSKKISIVGQKYYISPDGYYYQEARDNNNNKVYKIVGTPSDEPNQ